MRVSTLRDCEISRETFHILPGPALTSAFDSYVVAFLFTAIYSSQPRIIGKKQKAHVFYTEN